jgi:hypothetical protein
MVNLDLSKVLPSRAYDHLGIFLSSFLPGLFFVFSLIIARPDLVSRLASNSAQSLSAGRLAVGAMGLFLAFVIGSGFILVDTMIQFLFGFLYQIKLFVYLRLCSSQTCLGPKLNCRNTARQSHLRLKGRVSE